MKIIFNVLLVSILATSGCFKNEVNPCNLITMEEVRTFAPNVKENEWHPSSTSKNKDNELCLWHDGRNNNEFMLFYFLPPAANPSDIVESGMSGSDADIINIYDVGDMAAAGFSKNPSESKGALKLLAAQSKGKTIGIRVKGIEDESSEEFQRLKQLAEIILSRI